jgi:hypothetical protein
VVLGHPLRFHPLPSAALHNLFRKFLRPADGVSAGTAASATGFGVTGTLRERLTTISTGFPGSAVAGAVKTSKSPGAANTDGMTSIDCDFAFLTRIDHSP